MSKYTFLLPAYKGAFLREALQSILSQTYADFKVLVSDDCSPEDLKSIVDEFADDSRLTYRRNAENMGSRSLVSHWNLLVDMCDTEWLIMASDDDVYEPTFLEEVDKLQRKYTQVDLIRGRVRMIDKDGEVFRIDMPYWEFCEQTLFIYDYFKPVRIPCLANYAFRTQALSEKHGFVNYPLAWGSDDMTTFIIAENGVATTSDILFSFRVSGANISSISEDKIVQKKNLAHLQMGKDLQCLMHNVVLPPDKLNQIRYNDWKSRFGQWMGATLLCAAPFMSLSEVVRTLFDNQGYIKTKYEYYRFIKTWLFKRHHFIDR